MQNFLPGVGSTLLPEDPDALRLMRQRQMAEMLMAQGAQPIDTANRQQGRFVTPVSPLEGLAKLLQTGIGAYQQRKVDERVQDLGAQRRTALARALRGEPAVGSVPAEQFSDDAEINRASPPFQGGTNTPVYARDPATQNILGINAAPVTVRGRVPQEPAAAPDDPVMRYRTFLADQLESGAMTPAQATQMMLGLQQLQVQRDLDKEKPMILPEGATATNQRGEVIAQGTPKPRQPEIVEVGGPPDARGNPTTVKKLLVDGRLQDLPGAAPISKGPLATATATARNEVPGNKGVAEGVNKSVQARIEEINNAAASAPSTLTNVANMRKAMESGKVMIGPTTTVRMALRQIAQNIGYGTDPEALEKTQEVISGLAKITLANRASLKGQGQITDKETELLERAQSGNIDKLSMPQLKSILDAAERAAKYHISENKRYLRLLKNNADPLEFMAVEDPTEAKGSDLTPDERKELEMRIQQLKQQQGGRR